MRILREFPVLFNKNHHPLQCKVNVAQTGEGWSFKIASRMHIKELIACPDNLGSFSRNSFLEGSGVSVCRG